MKIKVNYRLLTPVEELLTKGIYITEHGSICKNLGRTLAPLRRRGDLLFGYDQKFKKSIVVYMGNGAKVRKKKVKFGTFVFEIF